MTPKQIPKQIINCWFGRGEKSDLFKRCLESQQKVSGWNVIEINEDTIDPGIMSTVFFQEVARRTEWVKLTEFGRMWGLWKYGGVYMDADVELLRPLDSILDCNFFIGREDESYLNGAVMGSVPGGIVINALCTHFPLATKGEMGAHAYGPTYLTQKLARYMHSTPGSVEHPPEVFFPSHWRTPETVTITDRTLAHHHWAKSWVGRY